MIALTADNMRVLAARVTQLEDDLRSAESHAAMLLSQLARTERERDKAIAEAAGREHERDEARAQAARLRAALEPFLRGEKWWVDSPGVLTHNNVHVWQTGKNFSATLTYGDMRFADHVLAETPSASFEAIRAEAKREAQREMQSSTFGELVKGCETLSHRIESHEWDNMPVWAQRDWLIQQAETLHQQWAEKWRHTLDREADGKDRIRAEAGRERAVRELRGCADSLWRTAETFIDETHPGWRSALKAASERCHGRAEEIAKEGK